MKRHCNCAVIAGYELKTQWRSFVFFFLISSILLSALISIFSLAKHIPDELSDYIRQTGEGTIYFTAKSDQLETIDAMPIEVISYRYPYLTPEALSLPAEKDWAIQLEDETFVTLYGQVLRWMSDDRCLHAKLVNQHLISGRKIEEADNQRQSIWISDQAAKLLGVACGDSILFCVDSVVATPVNCTVAGIFTQDASLFAYYITPPLYDASLDTVTEIPMMVMPLNYRNYGNVSADLQKICYRVNDSGDFIRSVMTLIYALYAVCLFVCILQMSIVFSISKGYFQKRSQFFAICKAIGLQNRSLLWIVCMVMQGLLSLAFMCAMLIAPMLSHYIVDFLQELFNGVKVPTNVWTPLSVLLFAAVSVLLWLTCIASQFAFRSLDIVGLIRRENE